MNAGKSSLLLHPVRLRIMQALLGGQRLSVQAIGSAMPDVPQATLYRQLNTLCQAGIVRVASRHKVRGAVESVYELNETEGGASAPELRQAAPDDYEHNFMQFVAGLLADFHAYVHRESIDFERDGAGYRQAGLYLSDEEFAAMLGEMGAAIAKAAANKPAPGRTRRLLTTIVIPAESPKESI